MAATVSRSKEVRGPLRDPHAIGLSRKALARVLGSLLDRELATVRGRERARGQPEAPESITWRDDTRLSADGPGEPGLDSLERLQLAAAVNEMFHLHEAGDEQNLLADDRFGGWLDAVEAAWRTGVDRVTFMTSGSTRAPKRCTHTFVHLTTEASFLATRFGDRRRIVALAPAHHIYGFIFTALLADCLRVPVWAAEQAGAGRLARTIQSGDLVVSFPDRWAWLDRSLPSISCGVVGVCSTSICPAGLIESLKAKGLDTMVEVYGSSETAGIALRAAPSDPYRLMPQWTLQQSTDHIPAVLLHMSGWRTSMPDRVDWVNSDEFEVRGRNDGAVQVGGINVHPASVAKRLCTCSGVQAAAVRLMRPDEGLRLKAFIVPVPGPTGEDLQAGLFRWSNNNLSTAERPKAFTFGSSLPTSTLGKAADW